MSPVRTTARQPSTFLLASAAVVGILYFGRDILIPIALSVLLSFLLEPLVKRLERWRLGRIPSVSIVVILAFMILGGIGWIVTNQLAHLRDELPKHEDRILEKISSLREAIGLKGEKVAKVINKVEKVLAEGNKGAGVEGGKAEQGPHPDISNPRDAIDVRVVEDGTDSIFKHISKIAPILGPFGEGALVPFLVIFILINREDLRNRLIHLMGPGHLPGATEAINEAGERVSRYILAQTFINGSYGALVGGGLFLIGISDWALWGFLCGALRFIPYVGTLLGSAPPVLISAITQPTMLPALEAIGLFISLELILNLLVEPWFYGMRTGVTPIGILLAAILWTWLWGPIGLILATPLTVCLVVMGKSIPQLAFFNSLLGEEQPLSLHERYYQRLLAEDPDEANALVKDLLCGKPLTEACDRVLAPALILAERDWRSGDLSEQKRSFLWDHVRDLLEDLEERGGAGAGREKTGSVSTPPAPDPGKAPRGASVVCLPSGNEVDEIAAVMLWHLLRAEGYAADLIAEKILLAEMLERIEKLNVDLACVVGLWRPTLIRLRALVKRLKVRLPRLRIVILLWGTGSEISSESGRSLASLADVVATSSRETIDAIRRGRTGIIWTSSPGASPVPS